MSATTTRRVWATPAELVEWLQLGEGGLKKLQRMRTADKRAAENGLPLTGPAFIEVGRDVRYAWVDVHRWVAAQREAGRG